MDQLECETEAIEGNSADRPIGGNRGKTRSNLLKGKCLYTGSDARLLSMHPLLSRGGVRNAPRGKLFRQM
jgi:hypothetical protein